VDDELIRARLEELRIELTQRSIRKPGSARSSSSRATTEAGLEDVDRAMRMLDKGTYGVCEKCGLPISQDRLDAYPAARFCMEDQRNAER
jgi:RNA polymerase-binding transcription factor DksA